MNRPTKMDVVLGLKVRVSVGDIDLVTLRASRYLDEISTIFGAENPELIVQMTTVKPPSETEIYANQLRERLDDLRAAARSSTDEKLYDVPLSQRIDDPLSDVGQEGLDES